MVQLKNIAEVRSGIYLNCLPTGGLAYIQMKDLLTDAPEKAAISVPYSPKLERHLLKKGDLLFAGKGTTYLCKVFDIDIQAIASTTLYVIRLTSKNIFPDYLCWFMNQPSVIAALKAQQVGTGTPLIHKQVIEDLVVPIPDPETQRKIVELAKLQAREKELYRIIYEKRDQITNQLIMNKITQ